MALVVVDPRFGAELRRHREQCGFTLRKLAQRVNCSHTYLWELETGRKRPGGADIARLLDDALGAGGQLAALVTEHAADADPEVEARVAYVAGRPARLDRAAVAALRTILAQQRRLDDAIGAAPLIAPTMTHIDMVRRALAEAHGDLRTALLDLAAQWVQFAAWLHMAAGRYADADALLDQACTWAVETGDYEMLATVLSYKGHRAWLARDVGDLIGLTEASLRDPRAYVGQRAYDYFQLARGYALAGDRAATDEALRIGVDLAAEALEYRGDPPPWHYYRTSAFYRLEHGLALQVGGRDGEAIEHLTAGLSELEPEARRAEWVGDYLVHLGMAYHATGDGERAAATTAEATEIAEATQSTRLGRRVADLGRRVGL
jgi:transcriptional regulator with XRE-family HTH domain